MKRKTLMAHPEDSGFAVFAINHELNFHKLNHIETTASIEKASWSLLRCNQLLIANNVMLSVVTSTAAA